MKPEIKKDMTLAELLKHYPETAKVFAKYGIHCLGCFAAAFETIEQGAKAHGIDVEKFIEELKAAVKCTTKK